MEVARWALPTLRVLSACSKGRGSLEATPQTRKRCGQIRPLTNCGAVPAHPDVARIMPEKNNGETRHRGRAEPMLEWHRSGDLPGTCCSLRGLASPRFCRHAVNVIAESITRRTSRCPCACGQREGRDVAILGGRSNAANEPWPGSPQTRSAGDGSRVAADTASPNAGMSGTIPTTPPSAQRPGS